MKMSSPVLVVPGLLLLVACRAAAQEAGNLVAVEAPCPASDGFMEIVLSCGILGLLNWAGIIFWGILALPLGILSIAHCAACRTHQLPLVTKLLAVGAVWVFVLGWFGVAQGTIFACTALTTGPYDAGALALSISQAVYAIACALLVCQGYIFFITISLVVAHFKRRKMPMDPQ